MQVIMIKWWIIKLLKTLAPKEKNKFNNLHTKKTLTI